MALLDVAGHIADLSALPIAAVGFGLTLWQLRKTRKAAEAARDAAHTAQAAISRSNVLVLIPQLQRIEEELERAVLSKSKTLVRSHLQSWRWQAGQMKGLLKAGSLGTDELLIDIQDSISGASEAASQLLSTGDLDLADVTKVARSSMARATNELSSIASMQGIQSGGS
ncbi:hypothetical protein [Micromonospora sp. NBC_01796]|uniref:hypothetical protein n=1 Tax=Micromonospora sp. NBC_01796 TaxID=2975987 RepID=UPI002DDB5D34|nr:hypothetical protein [Micromonospora sp. NBC_01796]WSA88662.1 hypothetical protein OIE47_14250 [Micromonospora sp. NBC_01796]